MRGHYRQPAKEICNALVDYAVKKDDRLRQIGEQQLVQGIAGLFLFRLAATVVAVMGFLGLTLAIVGVYGVVSYSVSRRRREIGIRVAVGSSCGYRKLRPI